MREKIVFEEEIVDNKLVVKIKMKIRNSVKEPKISIDANHILPLLEGRHDIEGVITNSQITNTKLKGFKNEAIWEFSLKKKQKTTRKRRSQNNAKKKEPETKEKDLTKTSMRSRISDIANNINN